MQFNCIMAYFGEGILFPSFFEELISIDFSKKDD
jgi:hypothetical protein